VTQGRTIASITAHAVHHEDAKLIRNNQNRRRRGGNGPRPQQMTGGNNYGNRLDNRQRGNASQLLEKYRGLARDSQQAGDRVTAEYYLQYAEHYYRLLGDYRDRQGEPVRRPRDFDEEDSAGFNPADNDSDQDNDDDEEEGDSPRDSRREDARDDRQDDRRGAERSYRNDRPRPQQTREQPREAQRDNARDSGREQVRDQPRSRDWNREERRPDDRRRSEEPRVEPRVAERRPEPESRPEPRFLPLDEVEGPIPGLPGPARLSPRSEAAAVVGGVVSAEASPETAGDEAPAPKRRGRPRKVVAATEA